MSMSKGSSRGTGRALACAGFLVFPAMVTMLACVSPQDDYNAYVARAADAQAPAVSMVTVDSGPPPVFYAPDASFDDKTLVMACVTTLGFSAEQALRFRADLKYATDGSGRTVTVTITALDKTASNISAIVGTPVSGTATVDSHGAASVSLPTTDLPASANAVSSQAVTLVNNTLYLQLESKTAACAKLGTSIVTPPDTLQPDQTPCVFRTTDASGTWVPFVIGDFHCP
jgi:hypothetical protein